MTPKVVLHFENVLFLISSIAMFLFSFPLFGWSRFYSCEPLDIEQLHRKGESQSSSSSLDSSRIRFAKEYAAASTPNTAAPVKTSQPACRIYATLQYFYFRIPLLPNVQASLYLGVHF